jgi:hypothetical protein
MLAWPSAERRAGQDPWSAGRDLCARNGRTVTLVVQLAHGKQWTSRYIGLALTLVPREQQRCSRRIAGGHLLGHVRREHARIRFELLRQDHAPIALRDEISRWSFLPWFTEPGAVTQASVRMIRLPAGRDLDVGA